MAPGPAVDRTLILAGRAMRSLPAAGLSHKRGTRVGRVIGARSAGARDGDCVRLQAAPAELHLVPRGARQTGGPGLSRAASGRVQGVMVPSRHALALSRTATGGNGGGSRGPRVQIPVRELAEVLLDKSQPGVRF